VSIVAVLRDGGPIPAPAPDVRLEPGDTLVVVGTTDGISALADLLGS
jgi:TrkA domain protein